MPIINLTDKKLLDLKGFHLFHAGGSNCSARARLALEEKKLEWTGHEINLLTCEQLQEDYLQINPLGEVPALIHEGKSIYGSEDILRYLEEKFPTPSLLPDKEEEIESMWEWVDYAANSHLENIAAYLYSVGIGRPCSAKNFSIYQKINPKRAEFLKNKGYNMSSKVKNEVMKANHTILTQIENELGKHRYLTCDTYTLSDIAWGMNALALKNYGFSLSQYPNIMRWINDIENRPSYNNKSKMPTFPLWLVKCIMFIKRKATRTI
ncbi:glutathione S-transferase family protein [Aureibacter tunicatorum]|uniref:Glutathione S-transferase n=1 Tax=Aureibacter tunicatorum TaxID=866807 RepID=A0AAE3XM66_9BACT|nr:glutathione S-transferase family protein [Aureibacter tunicatorum]MDR6239148.1 glutathione S-transferase [Aureibacter tunicatorum]BDD04926.1 glutathione S-transferase [Aureibacter tunicatorum]